MPDDDKRKPIEDDEINFFDLLSILWGRRKLIIGTSMGAGLIALIITLFMTPIFRAEAVIKPVTPEPEKNSIISQFRGIVPGLEIGGSGSIEDLEVLLKSRDLTARVFEKYNLYPKIFPDQYDKKTGKFKAKFFSFDSEPPGEWDAIREAEDMLRVKANSSKGVINISFDSEGPQLSAQIVGYYLEEAKTRLQEETLLRARKNKQFIEEQLKLAVDPLIKERLYYLYGREVEKEMLAKNREQFAFTIVDPPKVPDRKSKPRRVILSFIVMFVVALGNSVVIVLKRNYERD